MSFDLAHIWTSMGFFAKLIAFVLIVMAIASVGVVVERWIALARNSKESGIFARNAAPLIDEWRVDELIDCSDKHKHSVLARMFGAIARRYVRGHDQIDGLSADPYRSGGPTPVDLAKNEAERIKEVLGADLRRGMSVLATVGSTAPFVGLLGTVVGIIGAFQGIATTGGGGIAGVSAGIAEALVE